MGLDGANYIAGKAMIGVLSEDRPRRLCFWRRRFRFQLGFPFRRRAKSLSKLVLDCSGIRSCVEASIYEVRHIPAFGKLGEPNHADLGGNSIKSGTNNLLMLPALRIVVAENENPLAV
jgi:hypothetical protein